MFEVGYKLTKENYTEGAVWCNKNNCTINSEWEIVALEKTAEEYAAQEIIELKNKLTASDYAVIKIAEGAATAEEYADLITQRAAWRLRINELEAQLAK